MWCLAKPPFDLIKMQLDSFHLFCFKTSACRNYIQSYLSKGLQPHNVLTVLGQEEEGWFWQELATFFTIAFISIGLKNLDNRTYVKDWPLIVSKRKLATPIMESRVSKGELEKEESNHGHSVRCNGLLYEAACN